MMIFHEYREENLGKNMRKIIQSDNLALMAKIKFNPMMSQRLPVIQKDKILNHFESLTKKQVRNY